MTTKCLVIEVLEPTADHVGPGVSAKGQPYDSWSQTAYISSGTVYPTPVVLRYDVLRSEGVPNHLPLAIGYYVLPAGAVRQEKGVNVLRLDRPLVSLGDAISELSELLKSSGSAAGSSGRPRVAALAS